MLQRRLVKVGFQGQASQGTPAASALYNVGVESGSFLAVDSMDEEIPNTWTSRITQGFNRMGVKPAMRFKTAATPKLSGLLAVYTAGTDVVTGTGPYTHACTSAADLPWVTAFGRMDGEYGRITDCKVNSWEVAFEGPGRVTSTVELLGITPVFLASSYTETNSEAVNGTFFKAAGGIFQVEGVTAAVTGGSVKVDNHLSQEILAAAVTPNAVVPGMWEVTYSLKIKPNDLNLFREVVYGTTVGTGAPAVSPYVGTVLLSFTGPTTEQLVFSTQTAKFAVAIPDANPAGGPAEITLEAKSRLPASGADTTISVVNSIATY